MALIACIVRFVPAAGSSAFMKRHPVLRGTFTVPPKATVAISAKSIGYFMAHSLPNPPCAAKKEL
jgi:hypothetical protein